MQNFSVVTSKSARLAAGAVLVSVLAACGGGGSNPPIPVAATNTVVSITPATGAAAVSAVLDQSFVFAAVPAFGTTAATTVKLSGAGAAPTFAIESGGRTATGNMTFGSCIFIVGSNSTFPAASPLAAGKTITVNPCAVDIATAGQSADAIARQRNVTFLLNLSRSAGIPLTVTVGFDGSVSAGSVRVGTVPTVSPTGSGG